VTKARRRAAKASAGKTGPVLSPIMIAGVVVAALLIVGGLILLGNQARSIGAPVDASQFPTLGVPDAPVTLTEYSDYG
jgi:hypothetical protein